jgi:hypothetical protein
MRRLAAVGAALALLALMQWMDPARNPATDGTGSNGRPVTQRTTRTPAASSNNHRASNANAIDRQPAGSGNANYAPPSYPAPALVTPLSQTVNGYTVTLYPIYASASRIVLTYTVQSIYEDLRRADPYVALRGEDGPFVVAVSYTDTPVGYVPDKTATPSPTREAYEPQLTADDGRAFPWLSNADSQILRPPTSSALVFDARQLTDNLPAKLNLHLELNKAEVLVGSGVESALHVINGPFVFDFSMPVDPVRRVAEVNQSATTRDGETITLERVIVTRHEVRVIWRLDKSKQPQPSPQPSPTPRLLGYYVCCSLKLEVGATSTVLERPWGESWGESAREDDVVSASLLDEQSEWAISAWYVSTWTGNMYYPPQPGPAFRFTVPPAISTFQPRN